jgi:hypothetical protein
MKKHSVEFLIAAVVLLASCAPALQPTPQAAADAIRFEHWSTGVGSATTADTQQTLQYDLTLVNTASVAIDVHSIDLFFNTEIGKRAAALDRVAKIDRTLPSNATYQMNGEITFDATGVTKAQIAKWGPPIEKITVNADYAASSGEVK